MPCAHPYPILTGPLLGLCILAPGASAQSPPPGGRSFLRLEPTPLRAQLAAPRTIAAPPVALAAIPALAVPLQDAVFYSDGYYLRLDIHRYTSYATLPIFLGQYLVGQKLYDGNASGSTRGFHETLASGTVLLFGVNAVTGFWNAWEGRKNAAGRGGRIFHGALMTLSGIGFLAAQGSGPESEGGVPASRDSLRRHRNIAITSMAVATVGYLYMLIKG